MNERLMESLGMVFIWGTVISIIILIIIPIIDITIEYYERKLDRRDYLLLKKAGIITSWADYERMKEAKDKEARRKVQDEIGDAFLSRYSDEANARRLKELLEEYKIQIAKSLDD